MNSLSFFHPSPLPTLHPHRHRPKLTITIPKSLNSPRGFGTPPPNRPNKRKPKSKSKSKRRKKPSDNTNNQDQTGDNENDNDNNNNVFTAAAVDDVAIPEVVTDRMMRRVGLSVGIPLSIGLSFFPLFYYLKKVVKLDVPNWVPFTVSFFFFGTALLGVSYGIVSASWDPLREGSLLGWKEARRNWPVFWESLWGGGGNKSK